MTERELLPSHAPRCFGCGPENPCGIRLQAWREGDEVAGRVTFGEHLSAAPGFAHGGAVAAALDDCVGFLVYVLGQPFVTAKFEVNYRKPIMIETEYELRARIDRRDGRKVYTAAELRDDEGTVVADASGLFLTVGIEHFAETLPPDWRARAKERGIELPW